MTSRKGAPLRRRKKQYSGQFTQVERQQFEAHLQSNPPRVKATGVKSASERNQASLSSLVGQGKVPVDASVDLHGKTVEAAWRLVDAAIERTYKTNGQIVRVITGKGYRSPGGIAVLASEIPERLRRDERVAEVLQAVKPKDGGEGAWFVRLKLNR